jgi:hypothetical protein
VIDAEAGLTLDKCDRINLQGCTILDCDKLAILFKDTTNSRFSGNLIRDDRPESKPGRRLVEGVGGGSGNLFDAVMLDLPDPKGPAPMPPVP